jgi:hypothetical protein
MLAESPVLAGPLGRAATAVPVARVPSTGRRAVTRPIAARAFRAPVDGASIRSAE